MTLPFVEELTPVPDVFEALSALSCWPDVALLESPLRREGVGRYSYLTADPVAVSTTISTQVESERIEGLPPFQGGQIGLLSYEYGQTFERLPRPLHDEFAMPAAHVGRYDWVLAWDHQENRAWVIAHGCDEQGSRSEQRARERIVEVKGALATSAQSAGRPHRSTSGRAVTSRTVTPRKVTPCTDSHPLPGVDRVTSNFSREGYLRAVERVIEYVRAGDIFQANLSQRLLTPVKDSPLELYRRLRECNPAPFAAYFAHDDWAVLSASPERFLKVDEGIVSTRPIKGTRQRRPLPEADLMTRDELRESEKDRSENVMIVDLLRNDLSRVCQPGSIRVPELCSVETYETVQHLVSEVCGTLKEDCDFGDLIAATFPGGSITGAPKVRAMEIITELEQVARGPYCGSLFFFGFDGTADSSLLIRTFTQRGGWISCPVGGGIVAQSDPVAEYEETLHKAEGMLRALV